MKADVLVIGAGPAGVAAACHAARAGLHVLIADTAAPGPPHDVMVSEVAASRLAGLGAELTGHSRTRDFELCFPACTRVITGAETVVTDGGALPASLAQAARLAGAEFAGAASVPARHVVLATGAGAPSDGIACAGRFGGIPVTDRIILAPVTPAADPRAMPAMVTVLPGGDGTVTVWLTRMGSEDGDPDELLAGALAALAGRDDRFAGASPLGGAIAGPLPAGFAPGQIADASALIVGDAAGLVNPFTGEGLGAALLSGRLAAEAIIGHPQDPEAARGDYVQRLSAQYVGYFETARHAARRYHLLWRMLQASAASDHVFLARARRAVLLPEGAEALPDERVRIGAPDRVLTGPFLLSCDDVQIATLRVEWPFLARLLVEGAGLSRHRLRPGFLFLAGLLAEDRKPGAARAVPAAAIELATFGTLAFLGAEEDQPSTSRSVDWAGATLVLAGDFLLAQGSRLIAESAPALSWAFADWLAELTGLRAEWLSSGAGSAAAVHASLMEFPARSGALLGECSDPTVETMRGIGNALGHAFAHAEDVLALSGRRTRLDASLSAMVAARTSAIGDVTGTDQDRVADRLASPDFRALALLESRAACTDALDRARAAIAGIPGAMARRILDAYAAAIEPDPMTAA